MIEPGDIVKDKEISHSPCAYCLVTKVVNGTVWGWWASSIENIINKKYLNKDNLLWCDIVRLIVVKKHKPKVFPIVKFLRSLNNA